MVECFGFSIDPFLLAVGGICAVSQPQHVCLCACVCVCVCVLTLLLLLFKAGKPVITASTRHGSCSVLSIYLQFLLNLKIIWFWTFRVAHDITIQHCFYSGCGSTPGSGTSICHRCFKKKKLSSAIKCCQLSTLKWNKGLTEQREINRIAKKHVVPAHPLPPQYPPHLA